MIRWTLQGTAQTATGPVPVSFTGIDIFRVDDGKLSELRQLIDQAGLDQQLAAGAPAGSPSAATPTP
jgi:predicted SnoaL-like aldol condensation-catalyzing enzyme